MGEVDPSTDPSAENIALGIPSIPPTNGVEYNPYTIQTQSLKDSVSVNTSSNRSEKTLAFLPSKSVEESEAKKILGFTKISYAEVITLQNLIQGLMRTKSSASPGLDGETKTKIDEAKLQKLHDELVSQTYQPKPTKRINIPKPDGGTRPLGISSQRDKVVQAALLNHLEVRTEKYFSPSSFGFRPHYGCHHALRHIKTHWQSITWIINVDIKKCFDTIHHGLLIGALTQICDQPTCELIVKLIKAGYVDMSDVTSSKETSDIGTPQGSLISPVLCNIYMHALDLFVEKVLIERWNLGSERSYVQGYSSRKALTSEDKKLVQHYPELEPQIARIKHNRWLETGNKSRDPQDPEFRRLRYIRYADDFMIGFTGPKSEAVAIMSSVKKFLEEHLKFQVNESKSHIAHSQDKGTMFLGTFIRYLPNKLVIDPKHEVPGEINQLKSVALNKAQMRAPITRILERAKDKNLLVQKDSGAFRATSLRRVSSLEDWRIVNYFSSIIRGILNYYSFINSRSDLWAVVSLIRKSCALTLADKHKLKTAAQAFKRYGPKLKTTTPKGKVVELYYPESLKTTGKFIFGKESMVTNPELLFDKDILGSYHSNVKTDEKCQYEGCTATENLEAHHVNPQANISNKLSAFEKSLIAKKRKTITLCREHHKILHGKKLTVE